MAMCLQNLGCYNLKSKKLDQRITLDWVITRELDEVLSINQPTVFTTDYGLCTYYNYLIFKSIYFL